MRRRGTSDTGSVRWRNHKSLELFTSGWSLRNVKEKGDGLYGKKFGRVPTEGEETQGCEVTEEILFKILNVSNLPTVQITDCVDRKGSEERKVSLTWGGTVGSER